MINLKKEKYVWIKGYKGLTSNLNMIINKGDDNI